MRILSQIDAGDSATAMHFLPLVCDELRKLAAARLANEKPLLQRLAAEIQDSAV